jgi:hypothetical protein
MLDITTLAAWGEFLGGIAVVVSLIYLASQIRQNSKLLRASTASTTTEVNNVVASLIAQDSELARIWYDGSADRESLSDSDRQRFDAIMTMYVRGVNQEYQFAQDGVITPAAWASRDWWARFAFVEPGVRGYWQTYGERFDKGFRDYVDGLIRRGEAAE